MDSHPRMLSTLAIHLTLLFSLIPHAIVGEVLGQSQGELLQGDNSNRSDPDVDLLPPQPSSGYSDFVPTTPFGDETVPYEIFTSSDPKYMRRSILVRPSEDKDVVHGPAVCRTGTFSTQPLSVFTTSPANALGRWYFKLGTLDWMYCSATLIGSNVILTAAHCLFDCATGARISSGTFYSNYFNGTFKDYAAFKSYQMYTNCTKENIALYDFAVVRLQKPLAPTLSSYPKAVTTTSAAFVASKSAFLYSYPYSVSQGNIPVFSSNSPVIPSFPRPSQLETDVSIVSGSSGSAMFLTGLPSPQFPNATSIVAVASYYYSDNNCPNGFAAFQTGAYNVATLLAQLAA